MRTDLSLAVHGLVSPSTTQSTRFPAACWTKPPVQRAFPSVCTVKRPHSTHRGKPCAEGRSAGAEGSCQRRRQVTLLAHSAGGWLARAYLADPLHFDACEAQAAGTQHNRRATAAAACHQCIYAINGSRNSEYDIPARMRVRRSGKAQCTIYYFLLWRARRRSRGRLGLPAAVHVGQGHWPTCSCMRSLCPLDDPPGCRVPLAALPESSCLGHERVMSPSSLSRTLSIEETFWYHVVAALGPPTSKVLTGVSYCAITSMLASMTETR